MGLQKKEKISYLKIADGKLRAKSTKDNPNAEERYVEINDKFLYELVYTTCEGYIRAILQQDHEEYGTSYSLVLYDPATREKYSLQMGEKSRYFASLVMHLPNIDLSKPVEVKPYSFKQDGKSSIGISFKQDGKKVPNFYKDYDAESNTTTPKHGMEAFDFAKVKNDKDERSILQIKLLKFFKAELKKQVERLLTFCEKNPLPEGDVAGPVVSAEPDAEVVAGDEGGDEGEATTSSKGKKSTTKPVAKPKGKGKATRGKVNY